MILSAADVTISGETIMLTWQIVLLGITMILGFYLCGVVIWAVVMGIDVGREVFASQHSLREALLLVLLIVLAALYHGLFWPKYVLEDAREVQRQKKLFWAAAAKSGQPKTVNRTNIVHLKARRRPR